MEQDNITPTTKLTQVETTPSLPEQKVVLVIPSKTILKVIIFILVTWILVSAGKLIASALLLLTVAIFLAVALNPVVQFLQRRGLSRLLAVVVLALSGILIAGGIGAAVFPPLINQSGKLAADTPRLRQELSHNKKLAAFDHKYHLLNKAIASVGDLPTVIRHDATAIITVLLSSIIGALTLLFLTAFLLYEGEDIIKGAVIIWPGLVERRSWGLIQEAYHTVGGYVSGTLLVAVIDGIVILIVLSIFQVPFVLPLALWATLWGIVPIIGGAVGTLPAILVAFTVSPLAGIIVLVVSGVYHIIIRAILHPAIVGRAIEMSPFFVFIAILFGDKLLGLVGIILAIPFASIMQLIVADLLNEHREISTTEEVDLPPLTKDEPEADNGSPGLAD